MSKPRNSKGGNTNGFIDGSSTGGTATPISVAEEALETASNSSNGAGFLKKTISKIWKIPQDISNGVSYQEINEGNSSVKAKVNGVNSEEIDASAKSSCIIS